MYRAAFLALVIILVLSCVRMYWYQRLAALLSILMIGVGMMFVQNTLIAFLLGLGGGAWGLVLIQDLIACHRIWLMQSGRRVSWFICPFR